MTKLRRIVLIFEGACVFITLSFTIFNIVLGILHSLSISFIAAIICSLCTLVCIGNFACTYCLFRED